MSNRRDIMCCLVCFKEKDEDVFLAWERLSPREIYASSGVCLNSQELFLGKLFQYPLLYDKRREYTNLFYNPIIFILQSPNKSNGNSLNGGKLLYFFFSLSLVRPMMTIRRHVVVDWVYVNLIHFCYWRFSSSHRSLLSLAARVENYIDFFSRSRCYHNSVLGTMCRSI